MKKNTHYEFTLTLKYTLAGQEYVISMHINFLCLVLLLIRVVFTYDEGDVVAVIVW